MIHLAELPFRIENLGGFPFTQEEETYLRTIGTPTAVSPLPEFRMDIVPEAIFQFPDVPKRGTPARIVWFEDRVRVVHDDFQAEVLPFERRGSLFRRHRCTYAFMAALRTALTAVLPLDGGFALHGAAVSDGARGWAFFGPSGAGKTTLASTSPFDVISDEEVVVRGMPFVLGANGFWGALAAMDAPRGMVAMGAVAELDKSARFSLSRLERGDAVKALVRSLRVYPVRGLWEATLLNIQNLVESIPVFRMGWSPEAPVWEPFVRALEDAGAGR
ncbi:MAG: hypothetical protein WBX15_18675 [Thermoanaerobaculia bacterium]